MVEPSTARHEAHRGDSGFAEANAGLQPAAVLKPDRDNDTSVIRGPAIRKAGWLNSNGAVKHTAACEKSYISGVIRKSTEKPYFQKALPVLFQRDTWQALSISVYGDWRQQQMKENWVYRRGDLYLANLGVPVGSKQGGVRPVVVLQNDVGNYYAPTITIAPLTSKIEKKRKQPTHFFLRKAKGLAKPSMVLAEQLDTCDKVCVIRYLGRVSKGQMRGIDEAVRIQLGYYIPEQAEKKKTGQMPKGWRRRRWIN